MTALKTEGAAHRTGRRVRLALTCACAAAIANLGCVGTALAQQQAEPAMTGPATNVGYGARLFDASPAVPQRPDQRIELSMKIDQPFTVVTLGDMLQFQPFANSNDPRVQAIISVARNADVTTANLENEIRDFDNFGHAGVNLATKEVADDFALMGIDLMSRANNKDQRAPGVWETLGQVRRVGIIHAGAARSMDEARMARYFSTPKGLVGFVSVYSLGGIDSCCTGGQRVAVSPQQLAGVRAIKDSILARRNEVEVGVSPPADPPGEVRVFGVTFADAASPPNQADEAGRQPQQAQLARQATVSPDDATINTIRVTLFHGVTADQMALLREIAGNKDATDDLVAFGRQFRLMDKPGEHSFDMNPDDLREALTAIRTAKQASDLLIVNFHWHQNRYDFQTYSHDHFPADFQIKFARMAIEQGVDVFVGNGVHTLKGVEIYRGKPIFYGTSNFVHQSSILPHALGRYPGQPKAPLNRLFYPGLKEVEAMRAKGDVIVGDHEVQGLLNLKPYLEAILPASHFENGRLTEVRIYPVDLGQTPRPGSQIGIPRRPTPEIAKKILDEVIEYSKPFGTQIEVKDGVGIIRLREAR